MGKIFYKLGISALILGLIWFGISRINLVDKLKIEERKDATEEKLGELLLDLFKKNSKVIDDPEVLDIIHKIHAKICLENELDSTKYTLHLLDEGDVNAFAVPNNNIVIFSGLIEECKSVEELAGVLAHEMAHCEKNHVMKKLGRNLGASVLFAITTGGADITVIQEAANLLTSTSYDRTLESEADNVGVDYLLEAKIHPKHLADFLYRLSLEQSDMPKFMDLISTHPGSEERSKEILEKIQDMDIEEEALIDSTEWAMLKAM